MVARHFPLQPPAQIGVAPTVYHSPLGAFNASDSSLEVITFGYAHALRVFRLSPRTCELIRTVTTIVTPPENTTIKAIIIAIRRMLAN